MVANTPIHPIRIPDAKWRALALLAAREDRSVSYMVNRAIDLLLAEEEET